MLTPYEMDRAMEYRDAYDEGWCEVFVSLVRKGVITKEEAVREAGDKKDRLLKMLGEDEKTS